MNADVLSAHRRCKCLCTANNTELVGVSRSSPFAIERFARVYLGWCARRRARRSRPHAIDRSIDRSRVRNHATSRARARGSVRSRRTASRPSSSSSSIARDFDVDARAARVAKTYSLRSIEYDIERHTGHMKRSVRTPPTTTSSRRVARRSVGRSCERVHVRDARPPRASDRWHDVHGVMDVHGMMDARRRRGRGRARTRTTMRGRTTLQRRGRRRETSFHDRRSPLMLVHRNTRTGLTTTTGLRPGRGGRRRPTIRTTRTTRTTPTTRANARAFTVADARSMTQFSPP